ncbi:hypothetical protein MIR68_012018 [Amoeboaphelidium protococcarum]|nr:hypothetical protein MIR68_012018 [Amoeboaphelidium protococcarum]
MFGVQVSSANVKLSVSALGKFSCILTYYDSNKCSGQPSQILGYSINMNHSCPSNTCLPGASNLTYKVPVDYTLVTRCAPAGKVFDTDNFTQPMAMTNTYDSPDCSGDPYLVVAQKANTCVPMLGNDIPYSLYSCGDDSYQYKACYDSACSNCTAPTNVVQQCISLGCSSLGTVFLKPDSNFTASVPYLPFPLLDLDKYIAPSIAYILAVPNTVSGTYKQSNEYLSGNCSSAQPDIVVTQKVNNASACVINGDQQCKQLNKTSLNTLIGYSSKSEQCVSKQVMNVTGWTERVVATYKFDTSYKCEGDPDQGTIVKAGLCLPIASGLYTHQKYECGQANVLTLSKCFDSKCNNCSVSPMGNSNCEPKGQVGSVGTVCLDSSSQYKAPFRLTSGATMVQATLIFTYSVVALTIMMVLI